MAQGDGRISLFGLLKQHRRHRFAYNVASSEDDSLGALRVHMAPNEQLLNAGRSTRSKAAGVSEHKLADINWMKTIYVLFWPDAGIDPRRVDVGWQRGLHENPVNARVRVQHLQYCEQFLFSGGGRKDLGFRIKAKARTGALLHADIYFRGGIFSP